MVHVDGHIDDDKVVRKISEQDAEAIAKHFKLI